MSMGNLFDIRGKVALVTGGSRGIGEMIAAGFVGKLMCDYIKGRGGIAIDLGSIVDHWIGHQTRGNFLYFEVDFSLAASLVQGHPLPQLAPPERSSAPFQSDGQRQVNLYPQLRGYSDGKLPEQVSTQVGLIGHPRCGSGYAAVALQMRGLDIGHEFLDQDGMVSWLAAVEDFSSPSGAATAGLTFECLGAYHRDPYEAVPSIVLENGKASSFLFRRFHIFNHFGVDLLQFQDPLDRAVASLVYWMRIVDQRRPVFNIRVEHFDQDLE